jgi:hypothetical protein
MNRKLMLPGIILVALFVILSAGCTSSSNPIAGTTVQTTAPLATTPAGMAAPLAGDQVSYTNAASGISLSVPSSWTKDEPGTFALRDYGTNTQNIVNFYLTGTSTYALSIDVDPSYTGNLEDYFNHAIVSLQSSYSAKGMQWKSTGTYFQLQISGNKAYRADYSINEVNNNIPKATGSIIFTQVNGMVYVFTYSGNSIDNIVPMLKTITINPMPAGTTVSRV